MPSADPDAALHFHGDHQVRPGEIEAPFALGVEAVLGDWLGQAEAAEDVGEGHAWGGVVKEVPPLGASLVGASGRTEKRTGLASCRVPLGDMRLAFAFLTHALACNFQKRYQLSQPGILGPRHVALVPERIAIHT